MEVKIKKQQHFARFRLLCPIFGFCSNLSVNSNVFQTKVHYSEMDMGMQ